jgi:hypothetical protein
MSATLKIGKSQKIRSTGPDPQVVAPLSLAIKHRQENEREDRDGNEEPARVIPDTHPERRALIECEGQRHQAPEELGTLDRENLERPALRDDIQRHDDREQRPEDEIFWPHALFSDPSPPTLRGSRSRLERVGK